MIRLTEEYMIDHGHPDAWASLRHFCPDTDPYFRVYGHHIHKGRCSECNTKTPKNIMMTYNLWKFHNG